MKDILLLNKIAKVGTDIFDTDKFNYSDSVDNPDAIMVRSASMHNMEFGDNLLAIARAGAGVNNIPVEDCAKKGIVVFNTPGANANGVKELAIASLLLASRNIYGGINWAQSLAGEEGVDKLVEKGKSKFAGCEIAGKTLGVIGLGAIGGMVANTAYDLGMNVMGYDPYITVEAAWRLSKGITKAKSYDEIFEKCDYISIHIPSTEETRGMFCEKTFAVMKDGVKIINLSRADIVNTTDIKAAINAGKVGCYVTDFPTADVLGCDNIVTIPHLGASTEESEDNCAVMAAKQLVEFIENGNIVNSVNFPNTSLDPYNGTRVCIMHYNVPSIISQISAAFAAENINIDHLNNRSKKDFAYTMLDISGNCSDEICKKLEAIEGVIRIRVINK